ncbi:MULTISPECIES: hypothetical protein [Lysinibacillus]|uniref:hypothetical protein n=1 Tax=Lysinibacillus TaxID=400634 RepID=UPI00201B38D4|nr:MULTISPECIES: hypothetical protein [unclassified Lysinibacillus]MEE3805480.1 hypothetical protein [Lysinibacillus fusiformis]
MAINKGNTDFNLSVSQTGDKSLKVSWSRSGGIGYNGRIDIQRPGDGQIVYSKTYNQDVKKGSFTFEVPYFGEYKVHIKSNNGQTYDFTYRNVFLKAEKVKKYTYKAADVKKVEDGDMFLLGVITGIGMYAAMLGSVLSIYFGTRQAASTKITFPKPRVGDTLTTTYTPVIGGVQTVVKFVQKPYKDKFGNSFSGGTYTSAPTVAKYITYPK